MNKPLQPHKQNEFTIPQWLEEKVEGTVIKIYAQPKASKSQIVGEYLYENSRRLKIRIAAPPVDGEANAELIRFLKKQTGIASSRIEILRGQTSKCKDVLFTNAALDDLLEKFQQYIKNPLH